MKQSKRQFTFFVSNCASRAKDEVRYEIFVASDLGNGNTKANVCSVDEEKEVDEDLAGRRGKGMFGFRALGFGAAESFLSAGKRFFNRRD